MMQKHRKITLERVEKFKGKLQLEGKFYAESLPVKVKHWKAPERVLFDEAKKQTYVDAGDGISLKLGPLWATHWLHISYEVPEEWKSRGEIHFVFDFGGEALIYSPSGSPIHSLNGQSGEDRRERCKLFPSPYFESLSNEFYVECACNELFGNSNWEVGPTPPDTSRSYFIKTAKVSLVLPEFWKLYHDYIVIADIAKQQNEDSWESAEALRVANAMINVCKLDFPETFGEASKLADEYFNSERGRNSGFQLTAVGHCHIDTAWLWPYAETKRKCARSWATQLRLMERYPRYKFACSQAQQYAWVKQSYPTLFKDIQKAAETGNFVPVGGTWVEMDCNIPSGESLVRQFVYGQRFFKKYLNCPKSPIFWLPDTFGYAAQLPQIIRKAGMKYFLTQKLSWNQINKFPHNTFIWEGLDGSRVITHFPPADNYCSHANVADVMKSVHNFKDKERTSEALLVYGHGDGGGGPNPKMMEMLSRMTDHSFGGLPSVQFGSPVDFFERIEKNQDRYCVWSGELYFEYHRGTYTTQAKNKLWNRRSEELMREIELLSYCSFLQSNQSIQYDHKSIRKWWKLILLNQFHDVIPGTSIHCVYEDSTAHYNEVLTNGAEKRTHLVKQLANISDVASKSPRVLVVNPLGTEREEIIDVSLFADLSTKSAVIQENEDSKLGIVRVGPNGYSILDASALKRTKDTVKIEERVDGGTKRFILSNKWIMAKLDSTGHLTSIIWLANDRELVQENQKANHLVLFDDHPLFWDAWDVDAYHLEKRFEFHQDTNIQSKILETGPLRVSIQFDIPISEQSSICQVIRLCSSSAALEFDCKVQWHEAHKFLKVEFPLSIKSRECAYEIPYGWVHRPTHFNTSWDLARFEVCAHRWADLSEYNFGVALMNDCKYGYSTRGSVMSLSLLRSPKAPDETADMGEQCFRYCLLPHEDSFQSARVIQEALRFNSPLFIQQVHAEQNFEFSLARIECDAVLLDHVKMAEDSTNMILRFYEAYGGYQFNCKVHLGKPAAAVHIVNLLEEVDEEVSLITPTTFTLNFNPFEIKTISVKFL